MTYTNKTQPTAISPEHFIEQNFAHKPKIQQEALTLVKLYENVTGSPCVMWGKIFGFGKYYYQDSKGGEHSHLVAGFAISSTGFTLYNMMLWETYAKTLEKLGKHKLSGKSCLAIKSVEDIDLEVLKVVVKDSVAGMKQNYRTEI